jgi:hypothetical protein
MPEPLGGGLTQYRVRVQLKDLTGHTDAGWLEIAATATPGRLPLLMLAPIVTAYELALTGNDGNYTWRPDRHSSCPYEEAGRYFTFLASLGYQLSAIEEAVTAGEPYAGETPADTITVRDIEAPEPRTRDDDARDQDVTADVSPGDQEGRDVSEDVPDGQDVSEEAGDVIAGGQIAA